MSPERIYTALTTGVMKSVGDALQEVDRRRVSESLSGQLLGTASAGAASAMSHRCPRNPPLPADNGVGWSGWGNGLGNSRYQPASALNAQSIRLLTLRWAFGFPGGTSAYAQPAVVSGRVFVGSDTGYVYSLDAATGCVYWSYRTGAGVRTAASVGMIRVQGRRRPAVFVGDLKSSVYALDAQDGREIWKVRVDNNFATRITAAPALHEGRLYVPVSAWEGFQARVLDYPCCTAVGAVVALDAASGRTLWKTYSIAERPHPTHKNSKGVQQWAPAGVPIWNTPTIDAARGLLYVGTGDSTTYPAPSTSDAILALELSSGKIRWSQQIYPNDSFMVGCSGGGFTENCPKVVGPDWDIPMSPLLKTLPQGRTLLIFGTKPGDVLALDTAHGAQVWRTNVAAQTSLTGTQGGAIRGPLWGGAMDEERVYFGLGGGGMVALQIQDGRQVWYTPLNSSPTHRITHIAPATVLPGVVLIGGSDGVLWALSTADGHTLWSYETARSFTTLNGVPAHGGSFQSQGAVVAGDLLLVGSGYGVMNDTPGNVLLAFGLPLQEAPPSH